MDDFGSDLEGYRKGWGCAFVPKLIPSGSFWLNCVQEVHTPEEANQNVDQESSAKYGTHAMSTCEGRIGPGTWRRTAGKGLLSPRLRFRESG